ncbi:MAG TPA: LysE family transporter [Bacteriovoracaceae bacterium]|nr:LysE family transporter [Bacteriovoracaceae bacterium]
MYRLFVEGLLLQASLIFALGAQNVFVLESGLRRQNHFTVSFVCFLCDFLLIMLGVAGAATVFTLFPQLKILVGLIGVIFLFRYGFTKLFLKAEDTISSEVLSDGGDLKRSIILAVTFSVLNPHAYLDAFILIGGYSAKYQEINDRVALGLGASFFSLVWFFLLSSASSLMKPFLVNPLRMRKIMATAGLGLIALSGKLGMDVYGWIIKDLGDPVLWKAAFYYPAPPGPLFTSILF